MRMVLTIILDIEKDIKIQQNKSILIKLECIEVGNIIEKQSGNNFPHKLSRNHHV